MESFCKLVKPMVALVFDSHNCDNGVFGEQLFWCMFPLKDIVKQTEIVCTKAPVVGEVFHRHCRSFLIAYEPCCSVPSSCAILGKVGDLPL